jgi:hypothetical protein
MAKKKFRMTTEDRETLLDRMRPTPVMFLSGGVPMGPSQQDNANDAWVELGNRMGFDGMTVEPAGSDELEFLAVPVSVAIET